MKRVTIFLTVVLLVWPAVAFGQTPESSPGVMASTGRVIKDSWITSKTKAKLIADKRITRAVNIETQAGVVILRGKVASAEEKQVAEQIVHGTDGVKAVRNVLQIVPDSQRTAVDARDKDIKKGVKARMDKDAVLKDVDIAVRSDNGMVTLMGEVSEARVSARANEVARGTSGVRSVRNEIKVSVVRVAR